MTTVSALPPDDDGKKNKKVFKCWPDIPNVPYGPHPKQRLLFIEDLPEVDTFVTDPNTGEVINLKRPHYHPIDVVLYIGGARSGKTTAAVARTISYLMKNRGAVGIVGATNFPLLTRSALKEWGDRFKSSVPWDYLRLKNKIIVKKPTTTDKRCVFANGSQAYFLHMTDEEVLRGIDADIIHFEEASLLPDEASFEELGRRLSGRKGKVRQLILTTNPTGKGNWIDEKFKLHQLRSNFTGEKEELCKPCKCHLCSRCRSLKASYPPVYDAEGVCPECGHEKDNDCPGNQIWMRVIQTGSADNSILHSDYVDSMEEFMDARNHAVYVGGSTDDIRKGEVYKAYSDDNVYRIPEPLSFEKDVIWTLDFNLEPQCSLVCQEEETANGFTVKVLDEIVLWNALPEHAAEEFCRRPDLVRWREAGRDVIIYGDPSGLYGTGRGLAPSFYKIIHDVLRRQGFNVRVMMRKPDPNAPIKEPVKIPVAGRVDAVNMMLRHEQVHGDETSVFIRLKINPHCKAIIKSLREVRWMENGTDMDHACDKRAVRTQKSDALMTHPSDALGYYIYKRFPAFKNKIGVQLYQIPGESVWRVEDGKVIYQNRQDMQEKLAADKLKKREERKKSRNEKEEKRRGTLGDWLRGDGGFGSGNFGSMF